MNSLWWLALVLLALPLWWHRQRRQRVREQPLATARFLPRSEPQQLRVWRLVERALLALRCLLLAAVIAWLADLVLPWRGDAVLVAPGTDGNWAQRQIKQAGYANASGILLPPGDAFAWLALHEREWRGDSRLLVLGDVPMPALLPRSRHRVEVRTKGPPAAAASAAETHVAVVSPRPGLWRALFAAVDGSGVDGPGRDRPGRDRPGHDRPGHDRPRRYVVSSTPEARSELIVWDVPEAPPATLRASLWWITDSSAFPELKNAPVLDGMRYADSARGRLWASGAWPPRDAAAARTLFENWQRLHHAPQPYLMAAQTIAPTPGAAQGRPHGALHYTITLVLLALFAMERILTHARRR